MRDEFAVDHTKPSHCDEASSSTEKSVAIKQRTEQLKAPSSSSSALTIKQRNWKDFHFVPRVGDDYCHKILKHDNTYYDTVMISKKLTEQLNGERCYLGFIAKTPDSKIDQCKYG